MDLLTFVLVFIIGFSTAIIGVMVGSSGLLRIPLLILLGLPPQIAIATNKVGAIGLSIAALYKYGKEKLVNLKIGYSIALVSIAGTVIGAYILLSVDEDILKKNSSFSCFWCSFFGYNSERYWLEGKKKSS